MAALSPSQFAEIARLARDRWGLHLPDAKATLVEARIARFLVRSDFHSPADYLDHLRRHATEDDLLLFFDILSTNTTSFFREPHHFDYLDALFYPDLARRTRRLRIWSAACSTGPEPYTLAMRALDALPEPDSWDIRILATDLSRRALAQAAAASYPAAMLDALPRDTLDRHFEPPEPDGTRAVRERVRRLVAVHPLNLQGEWPMKGPFDVIFVRNVMIYFDAPTRERLVRRMRDLLDDRGVLVIGSAETLAGLDTGMRALQPAVYAKA